MSFDDMPKQPALLLPGAPEYAVRILALSKKVAAEHRVVMDVPYGRDYWQKVDFYLPKKGAKAKGGKGLPILLSIHGGAFRAGYKEWMGFMAPPILDLPAIYVSVSYRLAPDTKFPAIMEDCFDALKLVYDRAPKHGGDRNRIFICGHSAGGHLAALVALRRDRAVARGMPSDVIKGCFPVSGLYHLGMERATPGTVLSRIHNLIFHDPLRAPEVSPIELAKGNTTPFFVSWGDNDLPESRTQSAELIARLKRGKARVESHVFPNAGHFEANMVLDQPDNIWVQTVRAWMTEPPAAKGAKRAAAKKPAVKKAVGKKPAATPAKRPAAGKAATKAKAPVRKAAAARRATPARAATRSNAR